MTVNFEEYRCVGAPRVDGALVALPVRYVPDDAGACRRYFVLKRLMDLVLALALLLMLTPLLLTVAVAVKLDSPGPVLFVHQRVGSRRVRNGGGTWSWRLHAFPLYKFRSMQHGADERVHRDHVRRFTSGQIDGEGPDPARFKIRDDPRVTRVGCVIRRLSLDELPQLLNVVRGQMSLVGPRPVPLYEVEAYSPDHYRRFAALPGMTGLWQVRGRGDVDFQQMVRMDVQFVGRRSIRRDLGIMLSTLPAVVRGRGAA